MTPINIDTTAEFRVASSNFDETNDIVKARVVRIDEDRNTNDVFDITVDFANNSSLIVDLTTDAFTHSHTYRADVLAAFQDAFDEAYALLNLHSSPAEVDVLTFNV